MNKLRQRVTEGFGPEAFQRWLPISTGVLVVVVMALISSCNGGSGAAEKITLEGGATMTHHIKTGNPTANPGDYVMFHAYVRNGDSLIFSTRQQGDEQMIQIPLQEDPNRQSSPVEEALSKMGAGDSATVAINIDTLAQKPRGFENASEVLYDLAVTNVMSEEAFNEKRKAERAGALDTLLQSLVEEYKPGTPIELKETESGLEYLVLEEGAGAQPESGQQVKVHYRGVLLDGTTFDSSLSRGEPIDFPIGQGQVIPGWDEGIGMLKEGAKAILVIPPDLGYGQRGAPPVIPPNADLVFYVELVGVGE